jgi:hypothetical protein
VVKMNRYPAAPGPWLGIRDARPLRAFGPEQAGGRHFSRPQPAPALFKNPGGASRRAGAYPPAPERQAWGPWKTPRLPPQLRIPGLAPSGRAARGWVLPPRGKSASGEVEVLLPRSGPRCSPALFYEVK